MNHFITYLIFIFFIIIFIPIIRLLFKLGDLLYSKSLYYMNKINIENKELLIKSNIDYSKSFETLDTIIDNEISMYILNNGFLKEDKPFTQKDEIDMIKEITDIVCDIINNTHYHNLLKLLYNEDKLSDIIGARIYMAVTEVSITMRAPK